MHYPGVGAGIITSHKCAGKTTKPCEMARWKQVDNVTQQGAHTGALLYFCVCESLNDLKGGVDRSTEVSDQRNSRYGVPFSLDQCDHNVTGMCPLQSIPVTISHIRVGSACVNG